MSRIAKKITKEEFKEKLVFAIINHKEYDDIKESIDYDFLFEEDKTLNWAVPALLALNKDLVKDLNKVDFDTENFECVEDDVFGYGYGGIQTLDNGLTFLGCAAGGDWQAPVFFIIYHDGTKFRGYVPKDGNCWDPSTKAACEDNSIEIDNEKILADIKNRIKIIS